VLIIDDTGDHKDGRATAHVARQYLGSVGKVDHGIVVVTTLWANEQHYYPLHVVPYTPEKLLLRCMVPESRDVILSIQKEKALWQICFAAAPKRRREFKPSSNGRKKSQLCQTPQGVEMENPLLGHCGGSAKNPGYIQNWSHHLILGPYT
jgi:hypothetical protein